MFNPEYIGSINYPINTACLSELSLLQMSDGKHYPFADRLIEYLLLNVITKRDEITENVERVQRYLGLTDYKDIAIGVWTDDLRKAIYDFTMNSNDVKHLDITGFVDKDVEKLVLKYKEVNNL